MDSKAMDSEELREELKMAFEKYVKGEDKYLESNVETVLFKGAEFTDAVIGFIEMRKLIVKKPATCRALHLILSELEHLAPKDVEEQIDILNQSTRNTWQDVYEIKGPSQPIRSYSKQSYQSYQPQQQKSPAYHKPFPS